MNVTKIYINASGVVVDSLKDVINAASNIANRIQIVTPIAIGDSQAVRIKFLLANGQASRVVGMTPDSITPTETVGSEVWNVYKYDIGADIIAIMHPARYNYVDAQVEQIELVASGLDKIIFNTDVFRLKLGNSIPTTDSDITPTDKDEIDIAIAGLSDVKLNKNFETYSSATFVGGTEKVILWDGSTPVVLTVAEFKAFIEESASVDVVYATVTDSGIADPDSGSNYTEYTSRALGTADPRYISGGVTSPIPLTATYQAVQSILFDVGELDGVFTSWDTQLTASIRTQDNPIKFYAKVVVRSSSGAEQVIYDGLAEGNEVTVSQTAYTDNIIYQTEKDITFTVDADAGQQVAVKYFAKAVSGTATGEVKLMGTPPASSLAVTIPAQTIAATKMDKITGASDGFVVQTQTNGNVAITNIEVDDIAKKSVYDTDNNGIVDNSERLGGNLPAYYAVDADVEKTANKDANGGYLGIDANGDIVVPRDITVTRDLIVVGITASGDVEIVGNLVVRGTTTTVDSTEFLVADERILLNKDEVGVPSTAKISGVEIERGSEDNYIFAFEELTQLFKIGKTGSLQAVATREDSPLDGGLMVYDATTKRMISRAFFASTELTDMPSSLVGKSRQILRVKEDETGYELGRENNNSSAGILTLDSIVPSVNTNTTLYDITAGKVQFLDITTDPAKTYTIDIDAQTGLSISGIGTRKRSYLAFQLVDAALGTYQILSLATFPSELQWRTIVPFAIAFHPDKTNISRIDPIGWSSVQHSKNAIDMAGLYQPSNKKGNQYSPNGTNLQIDVSTGEFRCLGSERVTTPSSPNIASANSVLQEGFILIYREAGLGDVTFDDNGGALYTTINPTWFDDGTGTLGTNPGNNTSAVLHRIYRSPRSKTSYLLIGQTSYGTLQGAIDARIADSDSLSDIPSYLEEDLVFLAYFAVRKGATNLSSASDAEIYNVASGIGTPIGSIAQSLNDTQVANTSSVSELTSQVNQRNINELRQYQRDALTKVQLPTNPQNSDFLLNTGFAVKIGDIYPILFPTVVDATQARLTVNNGTTYYNITGETGTSLSNKRYNLKFTGSAFVIDYDSKFDEKIDTTEIGVTVQGYNANTATKFDYSVTILATDTWTDDTGVSGYWLLAKTVTGILVTDEPVVDLDLSGATPANVADIESAWGLIKRIPTSANTVTFYASEEPTFPEDTNIKLMVVR